MTREDQQLSEELKTNSIKTISEWINWNYKDKRKFIRRTSYMGAFNYDLIWLDSIMTFIQYSSVLIIKKCYSLFNVTFTSNILK